MKIKELNEAVRMGQRDLAGSNLGEVMLGFESEFFIRGNPIQERRTIEQMAADLEQRSSVFKFAREKGWGDSPMKLVFDQKPKDFSGSHWYIDRDVSIGEIVTVDGKETKEQNGIMPLEIVSPPMEPTQFFEAMNELFSYYTEHDYQTNGTTGFHVGISFNDKARMSKLDPLKVMVFLGEDHLKSNFERVLSVGKNNIASRIDPLIKRLRDDYLHPWERTPKQDISRSKDLKKVMDYLSTMLGREMNNMGRIQFKDNYGGGGGSEKSFTVAFFRMEKSGYVEFRILGGNNYHQRPGDLRNAILRFVRVMLIASDENAYTREYHEKIARMIIAARRETGEPDNEVDAALRKFPNARRAFYHIAGGNPEYTDLDGEDIDINSPENVAWRIVNFVAGNLDQAIIPAIKRRLLVMMKQKGITGKILAANIRDAVRNNVIERSKGFNVCAYFGLKIKLPQPDPDYY
jgi:hypothetical protein